VLAADSPATTKPKPQVFHDAAAAGRDYADQGEYINDWGGAQVIALGNDQFRIVTLKGGLPGAGWDGTNRTEIAAKRTGDTIVGKRDNGWTYTVGGGEVKVTTDAGDTYLMKRTVRSSPTIGAKPPTDARVLFDGSDVAAWNGGKLIDFEGAKVLKCGTVTKDKFGSGTLHIEFFLPFKPYGRGQDRANSGVYLHDRYEVQVLDSFGLKGENNECGGIYSIRKPNANLCLPPLVWQTYDIDYEEPVFGADGKKSSHARLTVRHNGVLVHERVEVPRPTAAAGDSGEKPGAGPIQLQDHGNPVYYRNIWFVPKSR